MKQPFVQEHAVVVWRGKLVAKQQQNGRKGEKPDDNRYEVAADKRRAAAWAPVQARIEREGPPRRPLPSAAEITARKAKVKAANDAFYRAFVAEGEWIAGATFYLGRYGLRFNPDFNVRRLAKACLSDGTTPQAWADAEADRITEPK